jgi:hypothetical protein
MQLWERVSKWTTNCFLHFFLPFQFAQKFKSKIQPGNDKDDNKEGAPQTNGDASNKPEEKKKWKCSDLKAMTSVQVEDFSKIFFPCAFLFFNIVFWSYYGVSSNKV